LAEEGGAAIALVFAPREVEITSASSEVKSELHSKVCCPTEREDL
jgi:hypothetical protein